ncbi:hypothetical protein [Streptomyces sp. 3213.3]|uniref:hypothetical protein n=1 Tax=Streptomyces sp. 3213.3 TaxID=1855348 RepID=UPI00135886DF|nr:hypothetical protein [Streptomyces sp. 3213.3]
MPDTEDFLTASLAPDTLQVDPDDPKPRPMIAVLDARPGREDSLRARIVGLAPRGAPRTRLRHLQRPRSA